MIIMMMLMPLTISVKSIERQETSNGMNFVYYIVFCGSACWNISNGRKVNSWGGKKKKKYRWKTDTVSNLK